MDRVDLPDPDFAPSEEGERIWDGLVADVATALDRERTLYAQELEALHHEVAIPAPCMAAATLLVQQFIGIAPEVWGEIRKDEGAFEATAIQVGYVISKTLHWRQVAVEVAKAERLLDEAIVAGNRDPGITEAQGILQGLQGDD
jgi:hypothetical protein